MSQQPVFGFPIFGSGHDLQRLSLHVKNIGEITVCHVRFVRTLHWLRGMSALPPKADINRRISDVRCANGLPALHVRV
jgi:hypothetical protein